RTSSPSRPARLGRAKPLSVAERTRYHPSGLRAVSLPFRRLAPAEVDPRMGARVAHGIVGRQDEVGLVEEFLADEMSEPSALLIEGEPGIGKTTLFEELLRIAGERGY